MKEKEKPFGGKVKCIFCKMDNFTEDNNFRSELVSFSYETEELTRLSKENKQDYLSVLCYKCTIGAGLASVGYMMSEKMIQKTVLEKEETGHDIISKIITEISSKYFIRSNYLAVRKEQGLPIKSF